MNKAPHHTGEKQLTFGVGNLFVLCSWFVQQHGLARLSPILTPAIIVAYALTTTRYRLDENLVTGKHGGQALDAQRSQAMFALSLTTPTDTTLTIPLVETVLFGAQQDHSQAIHRGLPVSTATLVQNYSLEDAKALCVRLNADCAVTPSAAHGGRFIVIDFLNSQQAREAADVMEAAGLERNTLFSYDQLPDACGFVAAGWVCELRHLADSFHELTMETAQHVNSREFIEIQNFARGRAELGFEAEFLTGDEVQQIVTLNNPDGIGTDPHWLSGPGPMNYWRLHFSRTLSDAHDHGRVHIMIVNTEDATASLATASHMPMAGAHWFVVAWYIEPRNDP